MKLTQGLLIVLSACVLGACPSKSSGPAPTPVGPTPPDPGPPPPPTAPAFDPTGYTLLGSKDVNGAVDHDVIEIGKQEGLFDQITLVVTDSDLELVKLAITFNTGKVFEPEVRHYFREGSRSRSIDLPPRPGGEGRFLKSIALTYKNLPGGGRAHVDVYAKSLGQTAGGGGGVQPTPTPTPAPGPAFDPKGWQLLGSSWVEGKKDKDTIAIGKKFGRVDVITLVVTESDLELTKFVVTFGNGKKFDPKVREFFKENTRTRVIDLPGADRFIKSVSLAYTNLPGGGKAKVEIYGKDTAQEKANQGRVAAGFDPQGWKLLGSANVDGKKDKDLIPVGKKLGRVDTITLVVTDSDLNLDEFIVTFGNGKKLDAQVRHTFKEGSRSRVIDLPGADRFIKNIALKYSNLPGGGKARVEIWGKDTAQGQTAPPK